ncbi:MAG: hypothetical protein IAE78_30300 [Myxococcus sp.]|nr:hypothetical protein [Myxococcus sp.]
MNSTSARLLAGLAVVLYPLWGVILGWLAPAAIEVPLERLVIVAVILASWPLLKSKRWASGTLHALFMVLSLHSASVGVRNDSEPVYALAQLVLVGSICAGTSSPLFLAVYVVVFTVEPLLLVGDRATSVVLASGTATVGVVQAMVLHQRRQLERAVRTSIAELTASRAELQQLVEGTHAVPWRWSRAQQRFTSVGQQAEALLGRPAADWTAQGFLERACSPSDVARVLAALAGEEPVEHEFSLVSPSKQATVRLVVSTPQGDTSCGLMFDITDKHRLEQELQQSQKLESVGRLASGIAHEINTPVQFVGDSVHFVKDAIVDLFELITTVHQARDAMPPELAQRWDEAAAKADLDYLAENVPGALARSLEGLDRVAGLVRSMKEFAHPDQKEAAPADLNRALSMTLTIARSEYKDVADVGMELGDLPMVSCRVSELNQVFLNLVVNAGHAIADAVKATGGRGKIRVKTSVEGGDVVIAIIDSGTGIPEHVQPRIFDPFFTTKGVGVGTGQGLPLARAMVLKHGGTLTFETKAGAGTTFFVRLPLAPPPALAAAA